MKKFTSLILAIVLSFASLISLTGCNNNENPSTQCNHEWIWESTTTTCDTNGYSLYKCRKCSDTKQEFENAWGCSDYGGDGYCDVCFSYLGGNSAVSAYYISNRSISYLENENCYRFCFALMDAFENYISCNATIEMSIVNDLGETVYQGTKYVTTSDYDEWYNIYEEWLGTAVYIYDNEIKAGLCEEGVFYYNVITNDNWFEYSLTISDLPTYTPTFNVGEKWTVNGEWELTILSAELHNDCDSNTGMSQYVLITYKYKNLGNSNSSGLAFTEYDFNVYDANGNLATKRTCWTHTKSAEWIDIGTSATASILLGFDSSTSTIKIVASHYDSNYNTIKANFNATISNCNHNVIVDKGYAATCVEKGLTDGSHCSKCGKILSSQVEIPISTTNHNYVDGKCSLCQAKDPSIKTPDIILGEYIQKNGIKQTDGDYMIEL